MTPIELVDVYDGAGIRRGALEWLYELMKERDPEINISHSTLPSFEQHRQFVTRKPYRCWYLIQAELQRGSPDATWVGYVSATQRNEIGVVLQRAYRGKGYGPRAILALVHTHDPLPAVAGERNGHWLANIAPKNAHSQHVFEKLGFREIQRTYEFKEEDPSHGDQSR